ncbi:MAG TPA: hypothetical protein ENN63_02570 [Bacteroidetes bacterium]|nr:hypothetical protein [Bacteroidota bacterium]
MSSKLIIRLINIFLILLMAAAVVLAGIFYLGDVVPGTEGTAMEEPVITNTFIRYAELLLVFCAGVTILISLVNVFSSWKTLKRFLLVLVGAAAVVFLAYNLATEEVIRTATGVFRDPITLKWTDTGLYTLYILMGLAILSIVYSEIAKYFK